MSSSFYRPLLVLLVLGSLVGCQSGRYRAGSLPREYQASSRQGVRHIQLRSLASSGIASSQLGPDDLVLLRLTTGLEEKDREPQRLRVSNQGELNVPLIGPVRVAGAAPADAAQLVARAAVERGIYRQPHVTIEVEQRAVNRVMVMGAVADPGVHEIPRGSSDLVTALAAAGGLTAEADTNIEILRQSRGGYLAGKEASAPAGVELASYSASSEPAIERIDLAMAEGLNQSVRSELGDRDVVMVSPRAKEVIHVSGLVRSPDQFELPVDQEVRLLDAVAMAGGLRSPVADKVFIIRQAGEGTKPVVIQASVGKAKRHAQENLVLAAGDMISVEQTVPTVVVGVAQSLVRVTLGVSGNLFSF